MTTEFTLIGVGAMNSPRYRPAGLLVTHERCRVMLDGGGAGGPASPVDFWLVCDARAELMPQIRRYCRGLRVTPVIADVQTGGLVVEPLPVVHTSHPTFGYLMRVGGRRVVWAPEFWEFPEWARGADLMFADAAGWRRPIRFAGGVGGHAAVSATAEQARRHGVARLVFAHIGRPAIRAIDAGQEPPYGEWGVEGRVYHL
ncbi:MBL fold metallo-hydrolase [Actinoallomurus acaciae]|uniref:MBL fold metallo-hydrolase n=1 Tax=Actinoallomurus acaciae TaxID=502577 RepID=A0ABV5YZ26_9ACTN